MTYWPILTFVAMLRVASCDADGFVYGRVKIGETLSTYSQYAIHANSSNTLGTGMARVNSIQTDLGFNCELLIAIGSHLRCVEENFATVEAGNPIVAGHVDGYRRNALFSEVADFVQLSNNIIFISDKRNQCIRQLSRTSGWVSTFRCTDRNSTTYSPWQTFNQPSTLQYDEFSNTVYVLDVNDGVSVISGLRLTTHDAFTVDAKPIYEDIIHDFIYTPHHFVSLQDQYLVKFSSSGSFRTYYQYGAVHMAFASVGDVYAMIADRGFITVYDIEDHNSFRLCDIDGSNIPFCYLINPTAIAIVDGYLYIGTSSIFPDPNGYLSANIYRIPFTILTEDELRTTTIKHIRTTNRPDQGQDDGEGLDGLYPALYAGIGACFLLFFLCFIGVCFARRRKFRTNPGPTDDRNTPSTSQGQSSLAVPKNDRPPSYEMAMGERDTEEALPTYRQLYGETLFI